MSRILTRLVVVLTMTALALTIAVPAFAHVTVVTDNTEPGGFAFYTLRVPTERDDVATTKIEVEFPEGLEVFSYRPTPGWDIDITDGVMTIQGGEINAGQFEEFRFIARNPEDPGPIAFPAVQTYGDDEEIVRWVNGPDEDEPASVVTIAAGGAVEEVGGHADTASEAVDEQTSDATEEAMAEETEDIAASDEESDGGDDGQTSTLSVIALIAGLLGLGLGAAAFQRSGSAG